MNPRNSLLGLSEQHKLYDQIAQQQWVDHERLLYPHSLRKRHNDKEDDRVLLLLEQP